MAGSRRISIGFRGGQVVSVRVAEKQLQALYGALEKGGWHVLEGEDGPVRVAVDQVVYVSADSSEPHVGFG